MNNFIDSHCHLDFPEFEGKIEEALNRSKEVGIFKIINVGVDIERSKKSIDLAKKFKGLVFATVGIHPHDAGQIKISADEKTELQILSKNPEVVAIGECGLDFFRVGNEEEKERQKELFKMQIKLAKEVNLPLIVHTRDAEKETIEILEENNVINGVVHCFTGTPEFAKKILNLGFYIGFTGIITFDKTGNLSEVISQVPLEKILIETDAPFLAPVPYRGKANEPSYVVETAKEIAKVKDISLEEVAKITTKNAIDLFGL